jgi:hypothetical protein
MNGAVDAIAAAADQIEQAVSFARLKLSDLQQTFTLPRIQLCQAGSRLRLS